jgi:hypothetical protein
MQLPEIQSNSLSVEQCRVWLNWSAAQIEACLSGDAAASDQLLASLSDVLDPTNPHTETTSASDGDAIRGKMAAVVVAVQFHDRLMQGLSHVVQSLRALHEHLGDPGRAGSPDSWRALRDKQFRSFSMAEERALFVALVAHQDERGPEAELSSESSVELFTSDDGGIES